MYNYIDVPMEKFSDRPDRTVPRSQGNPSEYGRKTSGSDQLEPVLNPAHSEEFGKADRKDRI